MSILSRISHITGIIKLHLSYSSILQKELCRLGCKNSFYIVELCEERGEETAGWAPVGGEVVGNDFLVLEGGVGPHYALVPP
jgi:hypothetical protein